MKPEANSLSLFKFKNSDIRVVQIDGEPWFVAKDVMEALRFPLSAGTSPYLKGLDTSERRRLNRHDYIELFKGLARTPSLNVISESGLYKLVMRSDKPEAKEFQNWVTKVILPAIRKDGGYIHGEEHVVSGAMTEDELVFKAMEVMKRKVDRLSAEKGKGRSLDHCDPLFQPLARGPSGLAPREQSQTSLI